MGEIDVSKCSNDNTMFECCSKNDCIYKQLQQLKAENEDLKQECDELRSDNSTLLAQGDADAFVISNLNFKIQELQQCLDEIEKIVNTETCYDCPCEKPCMDDKHASCEHIRFEQISQLIKQAKEN